MWPAKKVEQTYPFSGAIHSRGIRRTVPGHDLQRRVSRCGAERHLFIGDSQLESYCIPAHFLFGLTGDPLVESAAESKDVGRDRQTLLFISIEKRLGRAVQNSSKLPAEIVSILDSRVHALSACWGMHMRRIPGEKHAPGAVPRSHTDVNAIQRQPGSIGELNIHAAGPLINELAKQFQRRLPLLSWRDLSLKLKCVCRGQRTEGQPPVRMIRPGVPCVAIESAQSHIAHVHTVILPGFAFERNVKKFADKASATVGGYQIVKADLLVSAFVMKSRSNRVFVLFNGD